MYPRYRIRVYTEISTVGLNDGQGTLASFHTIVGIAVDRNGNLFLADLGGNIIRKMNTTGYVTTVAGRGSFGYNDKQGISAYFGYPRGVAFDSAGNLYVTEQANLRVRKINSTGYVSTFADFS